MAAAGCEDIGIDPQMMLPELLTRHPQARGVFDRYGLEGCGGAHGPHESIRFFARAHGVDEGTLLDELRAAVVAGAAAPVAAAKAIARPALADTIYRRYFLAGIMTILTAGASWGAWLLWSIGIKGSFTAISVHHVNAHGHAQIYGWVGLFIMGFGYQAFPRVWHSKLAAPRLAAAAFMAMLVGIVIRTIGMTVPAAAWAPAMAMGGGALELAAAGTFAGQILVTFRRSGARLEPYVGFVTAGLFWLVAQAGLDLWHTWVTMHAATTEALVAQVATWQAPLRDMQIHGLALMMIIGVSLRMLPGFYEVPKIGERRAWTALAVLNAAVVTEVALFVAYRTSGQHWLAALLELPWIALAAGCWMVAGPWKLWRPLRTVDGLPDRSAKFIRAAWGWLAISLVLLLALPAYLAASGLAFSHAYYGAIRHAITVGFISLMIMGYAAKVVATLNGVDARKLTALWGPFWLVNIGCFLRVSTQTLTDWHPGFFAVVGVSGMLEVTGLAWWGTGLARIMLAGRRAERDDAEAEVAPAAAPERIDAGMCVANVLEWFPRTEAVFVQFGLGAVTNPVMRRTLARHVTLAQGAAMHNLPIDAFVDALNHAAFADCGGCGHASGCAVAEMA